MPVTLSILVPALFERPSPMLASLYQQVKGKPVELIAITDNRAVSLAEKRNTLLCWASGEYVTHLDDDDGVSPRYVDALLAAAALGPVDVIAFNQKVSLEGEEAYTVRTSLAFDNELQHKSRGRWVDLKRKPWHWCAWRRELAVTSYFQTRPDEDVAWLTPLWAQARTERRLDEVLHAYQYSSAGSTFNVPAQL